ncbi:30S ribosomal protein S16 [Candidatus Woesebacteria bacterium]|nr:30S ribosomal protein S16 [Candidatus Woesebacteria bacterium]
MLKIRLNRTGVANKPFYRIVVTDERKKLGGKALEILGYYQPAKDVLEVNREKIKAWEKKGARVSPAVSKLIGKL